jgi:hypothetical protein
LVSLAALCSMAAEAKPSLIALEIICSIVQDYLITRTHCTNVSVIDMHVLAASFYVLEHTAQ